MSQADQIAQMLQVEKLNSCWKAITMEIQFLPRSQIFWEDNLLEHDNKKLQHGWKNQYDGKIDLLKLIFRFHLSETIYGVKKEKKDFLEMVSGRWNRNFKFNKLFFFHCIDFFPMFNLFVIVFIIEPYARNNDLAFFRIIRVRNTCNIISFVWTQLKGDTLLSTPYLDTYRLKPRKIYFHGVIHFFFGRFKI